MSGPRSILPWPGRLHTKAGCIPGHVRADLEPEVARVRRNHKQRIPWRADTAGRGTASLEKLPGCSVRGDAQLALKVWTNV